MENSDKDEIFLIEEKEIFEELSNVCCESLIWKIVLDYGIIFFDDLVFSLLS